MLIEKHLLLFTVLRGWLSEHKYTVMALDSLGWISKGQLKYFVFLQYSFIKLVIMFLKRDQVLQVVSMLLPIKAETKLT